MSLFTSISSGAGVGKTTKFTSNMCTNVNNVFVYGSNQKIHGLMNENHLESLSEKTSDKIQLSNDNTQLNKGASFNSSVEFDCCQSGEFFHVTVMNKDENDGMNFTSRLAGLDSSDMDLKFSFSSVNHMAGTSNRNYTRNKKLKKANRKLGERNVMQQLSDQDHENKADISQQNHESPRCGSRMDFSPYQNNVCSKTPSAAIDSGVKEHAGVKKILCRRIASSHMMMRAI